MSWLRDGDLVSNTSRTFISSKGNLTISPVSKADQGSYVCRAEHPLGTRDSQEAVLTVKGENCSLYQTFHGPGKLENSPSCWGNPFFNLEV